MINLFNLDINKIKHNGSEVLLMKLDGNIVYDRQKFCIKYTVDNVDKYLNEKTSAGSGYIGLPRIYTSATNYHYNWGLVITKKDGTITSNPATKCNEIKEVEVYYNSNTYGIQFNYTEEEDIETVIENVKYCNTSNFSSMSYMFHNCGELETIKSINWDTSKVTDMSYAFSDGFYLNTLDVSNFNTSNVRDMRGMFRFCRFVDELDVSNFDTSIVTNMSYMFDYCYSLTELDVSNFDTSHVTGMQYMFDSCKSLTSLDVSNWDTRNVISMKYMFYTCQSLTSLDLSNWNTSKVTDMEGVFCNCTSLTSLDLSNWDTSNVIDMWGMFRNCTSLTSLDLSSFDMNKVTSDAYSAAMFSGCTSLMVLYAPKNIRASIELDDCPNLTHSSLMSVINNLATVTKTKTLTLGTTNLARLTEDEKAIAINKGWTLA